MSATDMQTRVTSQTTPNPRNFTASVNTTHVDLNVRFVAMDSFKRHGNQQQSTILTSVNPAIVLVTQRNATMMKKLIVRSCLWMPMELVMEEESVKTANTTLKGSTVTNVRKDSSDPSTDLSMQPTSVNHVNAILNITMDPVLKEVENASAKKTTKQTSVTNVLPDSMTFLPVESVTVTSMEPMETFVNSLLENVLARLSFLERLAETVLKDTMDILTVVPVDVKDQESSQLRETSVTSRMDSVSVLMDSLEGHAMSVNLDTTTILPVLHVPVM